MTIQTSTHHSAELQLSKFRIYFLQFIYLATCISVSRFAWTEIITHTERLDNFYGVTVSFWAGYATLMAIGVFKPLKMLPLIMLQLVYKSTWIFGIALPMYLAGTLDATTTYWLKSWSFAVFLDLIAIPWPYVYKHYFQPKSRSTMQSKQVISD